MSSVQLPTDSSAAVVSSGLLGGKYLALVPGADDAMLKEGSELTLTQSSVNLEDLIGRYIFSQGAPAQGGAATSPPVGAQPSAP
jgi:phospholipid/cholesterol/gamma-HCH transport system substrate-binding protein